MTDWKYWTPERDGHAPDDWVEKQPVEYLSGGVCWLRAASPQWNAETKYRYRPLQDATSPITPEWCLNMAKQEEGDIAAGRLAMDDATVEPSFDTLKDQCLRLPQDQREALIEAMQKPILLPCPFCGGEASSDGHCEYSKPLADTVWADGSPVTESFFVNCMKCQISNQGSLRGGFQTKEKAIAAWNRRAS